MRMRLLTVLLPTVLLGSLSVGAHTGYAQSGPGPTLTVVGFSLANLTLPAAPSVPQLELSLQAAASSPVVALRTLDTDVSALRKALVAAGVSASAISPQGPATLDYVTGASKSTCEKVRRLKNISSPCLGPGFRAYESLQVTFPTLTRLATAIAHADVARAKGLQNFYISQGGSGPGQPSQATLRTAYAYALRNARETAQLLASAGGLTLGAAISIRQGAMVSSACSGMGCGPIPIPGLNAPAAGPNQQVIAVTVTYGTSR